MTRTRRQAIADAQQLGILSSPSVGLARSASFSAFEGGPPVTLNNRRKEASRAVEKRIDKHRQK